MYKPFDVKIDGKLPSEAAYEEFWEIICTRKRKIWTLKKAIKVDENEFMEYKKNRRDILHDLIQELDNVDNIPRYLILKPNPSQFKENKQKKKAQPKPSKKKKPKPKKARASVGEPKKAGRKFKLY